MDKSWTDFIKSFKSSTLFNVCINDKERANMITTMFEGCTPDSVSTVFVTENANPDSFGNLHDKIVKNMIKYKHLTVFSHETRYSLNMSALRVQGVLILNGSKSFYPGWQRFISEFVIELAKYRNDMDMPIKMNMIKQDVPDYDIFGNINSALVGDARIPIRWNVNQKSFAFTDGGCLANGKKNAIASFSAYIMSGTCSQFEVSGIVEPYEYRFIDKANPILGFAPMLKETKKATPTNNRGEYLAWCWILLVMVRSKTAAPIEIVSDSKLFINTITEWLPKRKLKGTELELKNYDLIFIADILLNIITGRCGTSSVKLTHINSHQNEPPTKNKLNYAKWLGNDIVDKRAGELLACRRVAITKGIKLGHPEQIHTQIKKSNRKINFDECGSLEYGLHNQYSLP